MDTDNSSTEAVDESYMSKRKPSKEQYYADLEKWLRDAYLWQGVAANFPYFFMCNYMSQLSINNENIHNQVQALFQAQHSQNRFRQGK